jgi:protoporphyrinogen IX oxidase
MLSAQRKAFERGDNQKSEKYFRILNEAPTVLMIAIVLLVVVKFI